MVRLVARASDCAYSILYLRDAIIPQVDGDTICSFHCEEPFATMDILEDRVKECWQGHPSTTGVCSEEDEKTIIEIERQRQALFARSREGKQAGGCIENGRSLAMTLDNQFMQGRSMDPGDPVDRESSRSAKRMTAATADHSKTHGRKPGLEDDTEESPVTREP